MDLGHASQRKPCINVGWLAMTGTLIYILYVLASTIRTRNYMLQGCVTSNNVFPTQKAENSSRAPKKGYLVWSPQCRIPDIHPLHQSVQRFIRVENPVVCSSLPPLIKIEGDCLVVVQDAISYYDPKKKISCCYQEVFRNSTPRSGEDLDDVYWLSPCKTFKNSVKLSDEQYLLVKCSTTKGKKKEVFADMHAIVRITPEAKSKREQLNITEPKMSVLIIGFDSISRLNLIRTMPHTVLFLRSQGWVDLRGYNKMEDNTCPNFLAILTGLSPKRIRKYCFPKNNETFDDTPFIWKEYAKERYITAYGEDEQWIGTFNYHKKGFTKQPTDYYLRYFVLAAEKEMRIKKIEGLKYCLGPTSASDHVLKYAVDFATIFKSDPFFALFWMNSFSHNNVNTPSSMDRRVLKFFLDLTESGALNSTFVVFLSDHGMRFGPIRETYVGWMEERLPFIYFWVPQWYRERNPQSFENLVNNGDKLTSPYDLHLTLQHVLNNTNKKKTDCSKCVSLFERVPWNRSCSDVGITEHWCTCSEYRKIPVEGTLIKNMAQYTINEINNLLSRSEHLVMNRSKCVTLTMNRILSVRLKTSGDQEDLEDYKIIFETSPGEATFEATVRHTDHFKLLGTISRINMYDTQSKCVKDAFVKKYCYCVNK